MKMNCLGIIVAACLSTTCAFAYDSHDYDKWEQAIKESALTLISKLSKENKIKHEELEGLLSLANETVKQRENDIYDRKCRVYAATALKLIPLVGIKQLPASAVVPFIGYALDQRGLGIYLGSTALVLGIVGTGLAAGALANDQKPVLAAGMALAGLSATGYVVYKCVQLEKSYWEQERISYETLEKAHEDSVAIKARLTALAAKNKDESKANNGKNN